MLMIIERNSKGTNSFPWVLRDTVVKRRTNKFHDDEDSVRIVREDDEKNMHCWLAHEE